VPQNYLKTWYLAAIGKCFGKAWRKDRQSRAVKAGASSENHNLMGVNHMDRKCLEILVII
jgi:hypothetical protein